MVLALSPLLSPKFLSSPGAVLDAERVGPHEGVVPEECEVTGGGGSNR